MPHILVRSTGDYLYREYIMFISGLEPEDKANLKKLHKGCYQNVQDSPDGLGFIGTTATVLNQLEGQGFSVVACTPTYSSEPRESNGISWTLRKPRN